MTAHAALVRAAALGVSLLCAAPSALAHAALSRTIVIAPDGPAAAISVPGFGIALRGNADDGFAYVCDALLNVVPSDITPPLALTPDALLIGSESGLRSVTLDGCPRGAEDPDVADAPVMALAVHAAARNVVYAAVQRGSVRIARSDDGGRTWELRARLDTTDPVTAIVLDDDDTDAVYVSQGATLLASTDGAVAFTSFPQTTALRLLDASDARRLWAVGRTPGSTGNRGFDVVTAPSIEGPWSPALSLNFFGGLAFEPGGAVWAGDEGGGIYRSADGSTPFDDVAPHTAVSDLTFAQGALYGCTPGLSTQPALAKWNDAQRSFDAVVALAGVARMPECPDRDVVTACAAAWVEWRRDVMLVPPSVPEAGATPEPERDSGSETEAHRESSSGCAVRAAPRRFEWMGTALWVAVMARRCSTKRRGGYSAFP